MILSKAQISKIKKALRKAEIAEEKAYSAAIRLKDVIAEVTNIDGNVDHLFGDGFGFTPLSNNDTHIAISDLIELAENGNDITDELILSNTTF